jgi:hypothetical protein
MFKALIVLLPLVVDAASYGDSSGNQFSSNCRSIKEVYKSAGCCGMPERSSHFQIVPMPETKMFTNNMCANAKPTDGHAPGDGYFLNINCTLEDGVVQALEQSGTNVTEGYQGLIDATGRGPITTSYFEAGLCPVNVHWHLGTEHYSLGQYDESGTGPDYMDDNYADGDGRRLAANARLGFRCHMHSQYDTRFTTQYNWRHCMNMHVGETYEVHWPHSSAGACGTPYQYQSPFYDGVFCTAGIISLDPLNTFSTIGVQAQIFTIINDEDYYYPDLIRGWINDGVYGSDVVKYTGSTTGTTRDNEICSRFTPITWQVDRTCHLISASSFDKMCADMKTQADDMSSDLHAHGARELVADEFASNNQQRRMNDNGFA